MDTKEYMQKEYIQKEYMQEEYMHKEYEQKGQSKIAFRVVGQHLEYHIEK